VLRHGALKPAHACVAGVRAYFGSLPTPVRASELLVVGDRVFTDVVLAHRLRAADARDRAAAAKSHAADGKEAAVLAGGAAPGTLAVWTTGVWTRESTLMRAGERALVRLVRRFAVGAAEARARETLVREFVRTPPSVVEPARRRAWFAWPRRVFG
jgi:phosphatidylglycerophosphatase GEP4